ncbi:MAG: hypothetical protein RLZZ127_99 [Planctomycetota bacterium]|jgi:ribosomal protein S18 acetylase RimI-like enzyme
MTAIILPLAPSHIPGVGPAVTGDYAEEDGQLVLRCGGNDPVPAGPTEQLGPALHRAIREAWRPGQGSVSAFPPHGDDGWQALLAAAGFRRTGVFMRMSAPAEATGIRFRPLDAPALGTYLAAHADVQAASMVVHRGGLLEAWRGRIAADLEERFRNGSCPGGEGIRAIIDSDAGDEVGVIWTSDHDEGGRLAVFIEEFAIHPQFRRRGCARRALRTIGDPASGLPGDILSLFVQPENTPAWALYQSMGCRPGRAEWLWHPRPGDAPHPGT